MIMSDWRSSSTWRFSVYVFCGLLAVVALLTATHAYFLHRREHANLNSSLLQVEKTYIPLLVSSLWITDYMTLQGDLEGMVEFNYIDRVEVLDEKGAAFSAGKGPDAFLDAVSTDLVYSYRGSDIKVGTMTLFLNRMAMHREVLDNVLVVLYIQLVAVTLLSAVIGGIFHFVIGRRLLRFSRFIQHDDPSGEGMPFESGDGVSRRDELQNLVDRFNEMRKRVAGHVDEIREWRDLMQYIIRHDPNAIAVLDRDLKYIFVSERYLADYRIGEKDLIGKNHFEIFPEIPEKWREVYHRALKGEVMSSEEDLFIREDGTEDYTRWQCRPWHEADGTTGGIVLYTEVITRRKQMERLLFLEKEQFRTTLLSVGDGVISTDSSGRIRLMNTIAEDLTGWTLSDALGRPFHEIFRIVHEKTGEEAKDPVEEVLQTGEKTEVADHSLLISNDGSKTPIEDSAAPIKDLDGKVTGVVMVFRDCREKREEQKKIEYLSYHDQLTGLYNRRFFEEEVRRLDVQRNLPISLTMIDVNGLKLFNDAFGHLMGDRLLKRVAEVLKNECRADDIIARTGGDEFVVLLPKTPSDAAVAIMDRVSEAIRGEKVEDLPISVSWGVAVKADQAESIEKVLETAEDSMYRSKVSEKTSYQNRSVHLIMETLFSRLKAEKSHSENVGSMSEKIGLAMDLNRVEAGELRTAGVIHDIGKIATPGGVLEKSSPLNEQEWDEIRKHPETGFSILSTVSEYGPLAEIVLAHHERWDGSGYPRGLKGQGIPLFSRIIGVAEAWDAMVSGRPYRKPVSVEEAIRELERCSGTQFDPEVVRVFLDGVISHGNKS